METNITMSYTELKNKCQEIARSRRIGDSTNQSETALLNTFFRNHHIDWANKTQGEEVHRYEIKNSGSFGTKCLFLVTDSINTDIGFKGCYKTIPSDTAYMDSNIQAACRHSIEHSVIRPFRKDIEAKMQSGEIIQSAISAQIISTMQDLHIDHYDKTFKDLVTMFIEQEGREYLYTHINMGEENSTVTRFTDPAIDQRFTLLHNTNTHLRIITKTENLSLTKNVH